MVVVTKPGGVGAGGAKVYVAQYAPFQYPTKLPSSCTMITGAGLVPGLVPDCHNTEFAAEYTSAQRPLNNHRTLPRNPNY